MPARTLRVPDDLDALLHAAAGLQGQSEQAYMIAAIRDRIARDMRTTTGASLAAIAASIHGKLGGAPKKKEG